MSLVSDFTFCSDGKWYKGLTYRGTNNDWFVCFDDDDPIELVIAKSSKLTPDDVFSELGWKSVDLRRGHGGHRVFGTGWKFKEARSYFIWDGHNQLKFPAPRPQDTFDARFEKRPRGDGVYYGGEQP